MLGVHKGRGIPQVRVLANDSRIKLIRITLSYCVLSGDTYTKIGTIQRRLAWPLRKDDTQIREAFQIFRTATCVHAIWRAYEPHHARPRFHASGESATHKAMRHRKQCAVERARMHAYALRACLGACVHTHIRECTQACMMIGKLNNHSLNQMHPFAYDHTTMNTPVLVRSRKLSIVGPG